MRIIDEWTDRAVIISEGPQPSGMPVHYIDDFALFVAKKDDKIPMTLKNEIVGWATNIHRHPNREITMELVLKLEDKLMPFTLEQFEISPVVTPMVTEKRGRNTAMTEGRIREVALTPPSWDRLGDKP